MEELKKDIAAIKSDMADVKVILGVNTESLKHHMIRTELNEHRIQTLEKWALGFLGALVMALLAALVAALVQR